MLKIAFASALTLLLGWPLAAQDLPAYVLYDAQGKEIKFSKMIQKLAEADIVFFGEYHDDPMSHWLELRVAKALLEKKGDKLVISMEMFETDNQLIVNEYFLGAITDKNFEKECRLWPNYRTDYKPVLELAHENGLKFIAANVPRRYASIVSTQGFEGLQNLPEGSLQFMADLPITVDMNLGCYKEMLEMGGGDENFPKAQALKDATMAQSIVNNYEKGECVLHLNGTFHSDKHEGTVWYVQKLLPTAKILVISTVRQEDISKLNKENEGKADFIICVPEDITGQ